MNRRTLIITIAVAAIVIVALIGGGAWLMLRTAKRIDQSMSPPPLMTKQKTSCEALTEAVPDFVAGSFHPDVAENIKTLPQGSKVCGYSKSTRYTYIVSELNDEDLGRFYVDMVSKQKCYPDTQQEAALLQREASGKTPAFLHAYAWRCNDYNDVLSVLPYAKRGGYVLSYYTNRRPQ